MENRALEVEFVGGVDDENEDERGETRNPGELWKKERPARLKANLRSDLPNLKAINKENVKKWAQNGTKVKTSKDLKIQPVKCGFTGVGGVVDMIDTYDRSGTADANSLFARTGTYANGGSDKPGERIPKAGVFAEAGVGEANAKWSVFEAQAKGPNAGAYAGATVTGASAMATAGIGTASAQAGPLGVKVGLQLDTGVSAGLDGVEAKFLGIGFSLGAKTGISFLGNELSLNFL